MLAGQKVQHLEIIMGELLKLNSAGISVCGCFFFHISGHILLKIKQLSIALLAVFILLPKGAAEQNAQEEMCSRCK